MCVDNFSFLQKRLNFRFDNEAADQRRCEQCHRVGGQVRDQADKCELVEIIIVIIRKLD